MTHGVLLLDKPAGISSNVALQKVRRLFDRAKAGHTGTLDPLATGLLPVCLGEATKFSHSLLDADKTYEAVVRLGFVSSTGDAEGQIDAGSEPAFDAARLQEVLNAFTGPILQVPPMYSALKKDGKPLYVYARAGEEVCRQPREVVIRAMQLLGYDAALVSLRVTCSKGTYIRVLAEDIGKVLGCGAYLLALKRTGIGDLDMEQAIGLDQLEELPPEARRARLLPVDRLVNGLPAVHLDADGARRVQNGLPATIDSGFGAGAVRMYDPAGVFLGVGEVQSAGMVAPRRMIATTSQPQKTLVDVRITP